MSARQDWQRDALRELGGIAGAVEVSESTGEWRMPAEVGPEAKARPGSTKQAVVPAPGTTANGPLLSPDAVPVVAPGLGAPRERHGDPLARRVLGAVRRTVFSSAAQDVAAVADAARAIQQPITTGRQIAVSSIRGGAGKTTVAALLALAFAHHRADPVLAVEADPALGTLPRRLGARQVRWTCAELARVVHPSQRLTDVTGYLLPYEGGGWLLPGSRGEIGAQLDVETYRIVMTSLRRYFGTTVVDCETLPAEVARTALSTTQARVLVCPATQEGAAATRAVLEWLGGLHRSMLPTTVVALTHTTPGMGLSERKARAYLQVGGTQLVAVPYDRSLAAGGPVNARLLGRATREAAARLAAEAMNRATSRSRARRPGRTATNDTTGGAR